MEILYFGGACSEELEQKIVEITKSPFTVAQNSLELALLDGLVANGINSISVNCMPCVPYEVLSTKLFCKSQTHFINQSVKVRTFPILKLPIIKYLLFFLTAIFRVCFWRRPKHSKKDCIIFVAINFIPVTLAVLIAAKLRNIKTVCMLTDCARNTYILRQNLTDSKIKKIFLKYSMKISQKIESSYHSYIFLTEKMNQIINRHKKPFIIMEGIYNSKNEIVVQNQKYGSKVLMYSGSLFKIYGIDKLIDVMNHLRDDDIELHIYGDGEYKNNIIEISKKDSRIKYKGFVSRNELSEAMQKSTLLINLRNPLYEYTQLSFPSKMMEYMASGTPVFSTMLEGIPSEYYNYIFYSETYNTIELAKSIESILSLTEQDLQKKGKSARKFILNRKNRFVQSKKVLTFLQMLCE
jgi:glycosyltransferase involved in cell wall biosynthesis